MAVRFLVLDRCQELRSFPHPRYTIEDDIEDDVDVDSDSYSDPELPAVIITIIGSGLTRRARNAWAYARGVLKPGLVWP